MLVIAPQAAGFTIIIDSEPLDLALHNALLDQPR